MRRVKPALTVRRAVLPLALATVLGCTNHDDRLVKAAKEAADRQAEQNRHIAQQAREITQTTGEIVKAETQARQDGIRLQRELVQADDRARQKILELHQKVTERDAQARQELLQQHQDLEAKHQADRQDLDRQRECLENERQRLARERVRDPVIAAAVRDAGLAVLCMLPVLLAGYVLYLLHKSGPGDEVLTEVLVEQIVARDCLLLPPAGPFLALDGQAAPLLTQEAEAGLPSDTHDLADTGET